MSGYPIEVGIDWNGDGFICWDVLSSHPLNEVTTPLDIDATGTSDHGSGSHSVESDNSAYGLERIACTCTASSDSGFNFYNSTGGSSGGTLSVSAGTNIKVTMWVKAAGDGLTGDTFRMELKPNGSAVVAFNTVTLTQEYQQITVSYNVPGNATGYIICRINSPTAAEDFHVTGFSIYTDASSTPAAFNTGESTDYLEYIKDRLIEAKIKLGARPYQYIADEARAELTLDNYDRLFSPEYDLGDLYGLLVPNRLAGVRQETDSANVTYNLFTGYLEPITPAVFRHGEQTVRFVLKGIKRKLETRPCKGTFYQADRVDEIIIDQLQHWDANIDTSAISQSQSTIPYYGDGLRDTRTILRPSIYDVIADVARVERGWLWENRDGQVEFLDRHHYYGKLTQATFTNDMVDATYVPFADRLVNIQRLKFHPRRVGTGADDTLYELDESIYLNPGETVEVEFEFTDTADNPVGGANVVTPTGANYVYNGAAPTVTFTAYAQYANVIFENTSATQETEITTYTIKGDYVRSRRAALAVAKDDTSVSAYGKREGRQIDAQGIDNRQDAASLANYIIALGVEERGEIDSIKLHAKADGIENETQVKLTLGEIIELQELQTYHGYEGDYARAYMICGITHNIKNKEHETKYDLEFAPIYGYFWVLDESDLDGSTILGY